VSDKKLSLNEVSIRLREAIPHSFMQIEDALKFLSDPLNVEIMKDSILAADIFFDSLPENFFYISRIKNILVNLMEKLFIAEGREEKFQEIVKNL